MEWRDAIAGGGIGGSGVDMRLARWNGISNLEDGQVMLDDSGNLVMLGDADFVPDLDSTGELGTPSQRWSSVTAVSITTTG